MTGDAARVFSNRDEPIPVVSFGLDKNAGISRISDASGPSTSRRSSQDSKSIKSQLSAVQPLQDRLLNKSVMRFFIPQLFFYYYGIENRH